MKETTAATTTTTTTFLSPSNMLLSPELVEIAEFLVGLSDRIEGRPREPAWKAVNPFGLPTTWSVKKKRSVPSDSPPPKTKLTPPEATVQESGLTGEVNGSPATPLGFCFSGGELSECKQESNPARAKTNNESQQINLNVPQQNDCLRKENLDKKEKASSSSEANLNLAAPSALQQLANPYSTMPRSQASTWYTYHPALIFSATAQFSRFPVAPRPSGIPDLNLSVAEENWEERMIVEDRCRPLHRVQNALHGKMMNQAMAAQARKNRIQIIKLKSFKKLPRVRRTS
ncbi:hypothetical protein AKJ16_DCAP21817 [Drosera capensis]